MLVIGFFQDVISSLSGLVYFITTPLGEQYEQLKDLPFSLGDSTILSLMGVSLVTTLGVLLVVHMIRLFIGG